MQDIRPIELEHRVYLVQFLCNTYPKRFKMGVYEHPLLGVRKTLIIDNADKQAIDIANIDEIDIRYLANVIFITTNSPKRIISVLNLVEDGTVL